MKTLSRINALSVVAWLSLFPAPANADWPMFIGDGDRTPPCNGLALVDRLDDAPVLWELKYHMSVGKGLYPGHLRLSKELGIDEPFYGGASSPIVADGAVFISYYKPDGKPPAQTEGWRTVNDPKQFMPPWFFSVTADDALLAVDAKPHWMPQCTHVLELTEAAIQEGGKPGRLLLYLTVEDGQLKHVGGFANQTTQVPPVIDATGLTLRAGRISGTVKVRYRADQWAQPLAEVGSTAAARYELDARLLESGPAGNYTGTWGVAWNQTASCGVQ